MEELGGIFPLPAVGGTFQDSVRYLLIHKSGSCAMPESECGIPTWNEDPSQHTNVFRYLCDNSGPNSQALRLLKALMQTVNQDPASYFVVFTTTYGGLIFAKALLLASSCTTPNSSGPCLHYHTILKHIRAVFHIKQLESSSRAVIYDFGRQYLASIFKHRTQVGCKVARIPAERNEQVHESILHLLSNGAADSIIVGFKTVSIDNGREYEPEGCLQTVTIPSNAFQTTQELDADILKLISVPVFRAQSKRDCDAETSTLYDIVRQISAISKPEVAPVLPSGGTNIPRSTSKSTDRQDDGYQKSSSPELRSILPMPWNLLFGGGPICASRQSTEGRQVFSADFVSDSDFESTSNHLQWPATAEFNLPLKEITAATTSTTQPPTPPSPRSPPIDWDQPFPPEPPDRGDEEGSDTGSASPHVRWLPSHWLPFYPCPKPATPTPVVVHNYAGNTKLRDIMGAGVIGALAGRHLDATSSSVPGHVVDTIDSLQTITYGNSGHYHGPEATIYNASPMALAYKGDPSEPFVPLEASAIVGSGPIPATHQNEEYGETAASQHYRTPDVQDNREDFGLELDLIQNPGASHDEDESLSDCGSLEVDASENVDSEATTLPCHVRGCQQPGHRFVATGFPCSEPEGCHRPAPQYE
ncbi:hypothetical protein BDP55DRAFT_638888 [Colletotrichum godetiae]|uniref:Uncharacterized protein n=1 Tax=Colletotrichum godetiae TaxID=1209918 RepID=A0AAJ0A7E0_9PEZI|nr:uncharacterized protein BDP55DRAFT_638888 [Colletotrichum godetiae]KAK1657248.1 hypothetical protein BDP55DRAFT_638888 [Colletotrichum godetiae]